MWRLSSSTEWAHVKVMGDWTVKMAEEGKGKAKCNRYWGGNLSMPQGVKIQWEGRQGVEVGAGGT